MRLTIEADERPPIDTSEGTRNSPLGDAANKDKSPAAIGKLIPIDLFFAVSSCLLFFVFSIRVKRDEEIRASFVNFARARRNPQSLNCPAFGSFCVTSRLQPGCLCREREILLTCPGMVYDSKPRSI